MPAVLDKIQDKIDQLQNVEVTEPEKLSFDDILIRIPNEEKAKQDEEPDFSLDFSSSDDQEDSDCLPDLF